VYLNQNNIYDSIHGSTQKNDYLEEIDSQGETTNLDLCEDTIEHIELVSQSDKVRVSIDVVKQFRGDDKNIMRCSAAFRLLMKLFSNPKSREQISSKECLEEILLTVKTCKRWQDVESGFRLIMFTYFEFSGFVFKLCSKHNVTNTNHVVSVMVMKVLFEVFYTFHQVQTVCT